MRGLYDLTKPNADYISKWLAFALNTTPVTDPLGAAAIALATVPNTDPVQYRIDLSESVRGSTNKFWLAFEKTAGNDPTNTLTVTLWYSPKDSSDPMYNKWISLGSTGAMTALKMYSITGGLAGLYRLTVVYSNPAETGSDYTLYVAHSNEKIRKSL